LVDHINEIRLDNYIKNLRNTGKPGNAHNIEQAYSNSKSGYRGVSWSKRRQKWRVKLKAFGKEYEIGYFDDPEEGHRAYLQAKMKYQDLPTEKLT
jgi:hypothetical protein